MDQDQRNSAIENAASGYSFGGPITRYVLKLKKRLCEFGQNESGATMLEYTLIVALVSLAMLLFFSTTANNTSALLVDVAAKI